MRAAIVAEQPAEADDDRILVRMALQHRQRPEIAVPVIDEGEQGERGDGRRHARRDDEEHDPKLRGAVHASRFDQVVRHALDELAQEKDAERVGEVRRNHAGKPAVDAQIADQPVERDERDDRRQEHRRDHGGEQEFPAAEFVFGEGEAREEAREQDARRGRRRDDRRVDERPSGLDDVGDLRLGVERGRGGKPDRRESASSPRRLEAGQHHPGERKGGCDGNHDDRGEDQPVDELRPSWRTGSGARPGDGAHAASSQPRRARANSATIATISASISVTAIAEPSPPCERSMPTRRMW